jgi:hypothetical protein
LKEKFDRLVVPMLGEKSDLLWRTGIRALRSTEGPIDLVQQLDQIIEQMTAG